MNAPVDSLKSSMPAPAKTGTASRAQSSPDKVCWVELKQYQYQPDHQVELLHLQAEADALILQLQAIRQKRHVAATTTKA